MCSDAVDQRLQSALRDGGATWLSLLGGRVHGHLRAGSRRCDRRLPMRDPLGEPVRRSGGAYRSRRSRTPELLVIDRERVNLFRRHCADRHDVESDSRAARQGSWRPRSASSSSWTGCATPRTSSTSRCRRGRRPQPDTDQGCHADGGHVEEPLALEELASYVGVSRRQLERLFKRYWAGCRTRYYLELRLRRARELLLQPTCR